MFKINSVVGKTFFESVWLLKTRGTVFTGGSTIMLIYQKYLIALYKIRITIIYE